MNYLTFEKIILVLLIMNLNVSLADDSTEWVWPTFEATDRESKSISIIEKYNYIEYKYIGDSILKYVKNNNLHSNSPEDALILRFSAIQELNYSWWLDTMDEESRNLAIEKYKKRNLTKLYWLNLWKNQFLGNSIKLRRKIYSGEYVIITYQVVSEEGKDMTDGFELPVVLKKDNNIWKVTLGLKADPLLIFSPWVSGRNKEVIDVESL